MWLTSVCQTRGRKFEPCHTYCKCVAQLVERVFHSCPCYSLHSILKAKYSDAAVSVTSHNLDNVVDF